MSTTSTPTATAPPKHPFPRKYFVDLTVYALLSLLAVGLLIRYQYWSTIEEWKDRLSSIADGEQLFVRTWVFERNGDLAVLSASPVTASRLLPGSPNTSESPSGTALQPFLDRVASSYDYLAIYVVDRSGMVRARSTGAMELPPAIVKDAQSPTRVTFEVLPLALQNQLGARMALIAPVTDGVLHGNFQSGAGKLLGGVVILTKARLIYDLPSLGTASTRTGESILVRREGDGAHFVSSVRHLASISPDRRDSLRPSAFAANSVLRGYVEFSEFKDYRGVAVFGVARVIPDAGWGLITKIDRKEALQNFYSLAGMELSIAAVALVVMVALVFKAWRDRQVQGLQEEISRRQRVEEDLRLSQAHFSSGFENAPIGMALVSPGGRCIKVNRSLCDLLGYSAEELLEKTFQDITHPDDLQADLANVRQMLAGEIRTYQMEKRYIHKSGSIVSALLSVSLVRDENRRPLHFISQVEDITTSRRINRALRTLSNCNQALIHATSEPELLQEICRVTVEDGGYRMAWVGLLEKSPATAIRVVAVEGHEDNYLKDLQIEASDSPSGRGPTGTAIRTGRPAVCRNIATDPSFALWRTEAMKRGYRSSVALPLVSNNVTIGALTIYSGEAEAFDTEELKLLATLADNLSYGMLTLRTAEAKQQADEALSEKEAQLRESQKMEALGQLAGGVAHDFNNLLGVIMGYSELLASFVASDPGASRRLSAIRRSAERAASLTAQLLAFSRRQFLQPKVLDLNALVRDTDAILQRLIGEDVEASSMLDPSLGRVKADPSQIVQVLINLVVNARDAMPDGGKIMIETANVVLEEGAKCEGILVQPGPYVMLAVSDNGTGMDAKTRARIFDPFFTTKPAGKGTGIGLATVYGIVQQSAGYIAVETELGKGTTFRVYLPRIEERIEPELIRTMTVQAARASETILLVEDESAMRELLVEELQASGYTLLTAGNGVEALHVAKQYPHTIHLLITDVIMPQMSGPVLVRSLQQQRPEIKVLYMSGYTVDKLNETAMDSEVALIQKPFLLKDLLDKVRDVLGQKETTRVAPSNGNEP